MLTKTFHRYQVLWRIIYNLHYSNDSALSVRRFTLKSVKPFHKLYGATKFATIPQLWRKRIGRNIKTSVFLDHWVLDLTNFFLIEI